MSDLFLARFEDRTLRVDPATGVVYTRFWRGTRKVPWRKLATFIGGPAKKYQDYRWVRPRFGGKRAAMAVHRIVWLWATGEPVPDECEIDHADRDPANNRLSNLRLVDQYHGRGEPDVIYLTGLDIIRNAGGIDKLREPPNGPRECLLAEGSC